jgi:type I restriction enzyme R subunit
MTCLAGCLMQHPGMGNPTVVMVTDRNDLDNQLFAVFVGASDLLRETPVQADTRPRLRELLDQRPSGGIIFTTIQKFVPGADEDNYPVLSERRNIVVICDEAHRSQYGFAAKLPKKKSARRSSTASKIAQVADASGAPNNVLQLIDGPSASDLRYGHAKYLRDALPNATFVAFTGTPVSLVDRNTQAVFGDYVHIYDIEQAVQDKATVSIYFESRLAKLDLHEEDLSTLDEDVEELTEDELTGFVRGVRALRAARARLDAQEGATTESAHGCGPGADRPTNEDRAASTSPLPEKPER